MKRTAFGDAVRNRRNELGLSQQVVAYKTGIHTGYIGRIEADGAIPSKGTIAKLAECLDLDVDELCVLAEKSSNSFRNLANDYPETLSLFKEVLIEMTDYQVEQTFDRFERRLRNSKEDRKKFIDNIIQFLVGELKGTEKPSNGNKPLSYYWTLRSKGMDKCGSSCNSR